jgi:hypothetical protein
VPKRSRAAGRANPIPRHLFADSSAVGKLIGAVNLVAQSTVRYTSRPCLRGGNRTSLVAMHAFHFVAIIASLRGTLDASRSPARLLAAGGLLVAGLLFLGHVVEHSWAGTEVQRVAIAPARAKQVVSLRDRLVVGLQARLKPEVAFVEVVAARVRTGHLPQRLVDETFFWARGRALDRRTGHTRRPIIFFQPAMTARAKRLNVEL